MYYEQTRIVY